LARLGPFCTVESLIEQAEEVRVRVMESGQLCLPRSL
jgi:hypothetical protein